MPFLLLAFVCLLLPSCTPAPEEAGTGWDLLSINLDLRIDPGAPIIGQGRAVLRLEADRSFGPTLRLHEGRQRFLEVTSPTGRPAAVRANASLADVRATEPYVRGDTLSITFRYVIERSEPEAYPVQFLLHPEAIFGAYGYNWHPQPLTAAGPSDKLAAGTLRLDMPSGWRSDSQGRLLPRQDDGERAFETWHSETPVLRRFVAGPFDEAHAGDDFQVRLLYRSSAPRTAHADAETLQRMLAFLRDRFGPNPLPLRSELGFDPGRGLTLVELPDAVGFGARNEAGTLLVPSPMLHVEGAPPRLNETVLTHELAHLWWGLGVRAGNPGLMMLHEGLPDYAAVLWIEASEGPEAARAFMRFGRPLPENLPVFSARGYFELWREGHDAPLMADGSENASQLLLPVKRKGPWVWHMLRERTGNDVFFDVLRDLAARHAASDPLTLLDVREAFMAAAPHAGLERFFAEWLDRTGAPILEATWRPASDSLEVTLSQRGDVYHLPLQLGLVAGGDTTVHTVDLRARRQTFMLPAPAGAVEDVVLDPAHRLLIWKPAYGPAPK